MKPRPNEGEVFLVPLGDGRSVAGQVLAKFRRVNYFLATFDVVLEGDAVFPSLQQLTTAPVSLLCLSLDAKLRNGDWPVIGRSPVSVIDSLPAFKVAVNEPWNFQIEDYSGTRTRPASPEDERLYPFRTVVAPIRLERAAQALEGLREWDREWDELLPDPETSWIRAFGE
ncbi:Imm26 family immunity protein [Microbacterium testaceum]|uniref:Imm26 family immunity protein n=1 Tax=Microbacterium testaceum TaxID=2033 RepID=UPI0024343B48|nr:Imm26 family immunity protein [Microbacterium testaceum]